MTHNIYYRLQDNGLPANAGEIRESLFSGPKVTVVPIGKIPASRPDNLAAQYEYFAVGLRSNLIREVDPMTYQDRLDMFLCYRDGRTQEKVFQKIIRYRNITDRLADLYFDCNKVRVGSHRFRDHIDFEFLTDGSMPNFKGFVVKREGETIWNFHPASLRLERKDGVRRFWVAPVNWYERSGVVNQIDIRW